MYGSSGGGRAGGRQGGPHSNSNGNGVLPDSKARSGSGRSGSMQSSSAFSGNKDSGQGLSQLTNRKARTSRQQPQGSGLLENLQTSGPSQSNRAHSTEDQDYSRLLVAMDRDLDRPESPAIASSEQNSQPSSQNKGNADVERSRSAGFQDFKVVTLSVKWQMFFIWWM